MAVAVVVPPRRHCESLVGLLGRSAQEVGASHPVPPSWSCSSPACLRGASWASPSRRGLPARLAPGSCLYLSSCPAEHPASPLPTKLWQGLP